MIRLIGLTSPSGAARQTAQWERLCQRREDFIDVVLVDEPEMADPKDLASQIALAAGKNDLALTAEQKCLELLPADTNGAQFKTQLEQVAKEKIAKLKSEQR